MAAEHRGRVVKALGDGVMLRFDSAAEAVVAVRHLMGRIVDAGLNAAHAGIATGSFVVRDGDVYGHTVNLASRMAAQAAYGEILATREATAWLGADVASEDRGNLRLKGIQQEVGVVRLTG